MRESSDPHFIGEESEAQTDGKRITRGTFD